MRRIVTVVKATRVLKFHLNKMNLSRQSKGKKLFFKPKQHLCKNKVARLRTVFAKLNGAIALRLMPLTGSLTFIVLRRTKADLLSKALLIQVRKVCVGEKTVNGRGKINQKGDSNRKLQKGTNARPLES